MTDSQRDDTLSADDAARLEHARLGERNLALIHRMEAALAAGSDDMAAFFADDFRWVGNTGCGIKEGLAAFRRDWQLPIRAAFTEREYVTERFLADGEWVACFGHIEATHTGSFMGIEATGRRVIIPYMDFWLVRDERIVDNRVSVDFPRVLAQLGKDVFDGRGWEVYDRGEVQPPTP